MIEIYRVDPSGTAARLGIHEGDSIISINGRPIDDIIDYTFQKSDERLSICTVSPEGRRRTFAVSKDPDDDLGIEFPTLAIKRCRNRCIFCFVDQMPAGCRKSLSIKDDDYRASFLYGNYITLSNLSAGDWERIFKQRLSPLYISVHATDPELRKFILGNRKAPDIMEAIKRLAGHGIRMHTQIVLCPGVNDGEQLVKTIGDLAAQYPMVSSIAVVPVGTTSHRKGLFAIKRLTGPQARQIIEIVDRLGKRYRKILGTRLVYPADEFYVTARKATQGVSFYEDFPQIENGVGMVAHFLKDARKVKISEKRISLSMTLVTGVSFSGYLKEALTIFRHIKGLSLRLIAVNNRFFGPSVTVAGLLTGSDILHAVKGKQIGEILVIPADSLKEDEALFLDGMSSEDLARKLKVPVRSAHFLSDLSAIIHAFMESRR